MLRWIVVTTLALVLFSGAMPWLRRLGVGRLPGDFTVRLLGRRLSVPLTSTLLLSMLAALIGRLLF